MQLHVNETGTENKFTLVIKRYPAAFKLPSDGGVYKEVFPEHVYEGQLGKGW